MLRLRHLVAPFALACAMVAAPVAAQTPVTSVVDQVWQQSLSDLLRAQQDAGLRSLTLHRNGSARETVSPVRFAAMQDAIRYHESMHRRNQRWSRSLLALGAAALVGGVADYATGSSQQLSGLQGALIGAGFGLTVVGSQRWEIADRARIQTERLRSVQLASQ